MEGVEDIPGAALAEGIEWNWETFPEYLDALEKMPRVMDIATQVPHGSVRAYVMGERGARNEDPTANDLIAMAQIVQEGPKPELWASPPLEPCSTEPLDGEPVPGTFAGAEELVAMVKQATRAAAL